MRLFISYAREDEAQAKRLFDYLKSIEEISPWIDRENIKPGIDWAESIFDAISSSQLFILLVSRTSVYKQGFVQREIEAALKLQSSKGPGKVFIIPLRIDDVDLPDNIGRLHCIDAYSNWDAGMNALKITIKQELTQSLDDIFKNVHPLRTTGEEYENWTSVYSDYLSTFSTSTIIRFLDQRFTEYASDLFALGLVIGAFQEKRNDALASLSIRVHTVGRMAYNYPGTAVRAYELFLHSIKFMPENLATMLLGEAFDTWLNLSNYPGNAFFPCLVLAELTKHYIAQDEGRNMSDFEIVLRALTSLKRYDQFFFDILLFYARRSGEYMLLASFFPALLEKLGVGGQTPKGAYVPAPKYWNISSSDISQMESTAINRKGIRAGILLRYGEYMTCIDDDRFKEYGDRLKKYAVKLISGSSVKLAGIIKQLDPESSRDFFMNLERFDANGLARHFGGDCIDARETIEFLMNPLFISYNSPSREVYPLCLDYEVFSKQCVATMGFLK